MTAARRIEFIYFDLGNVLLSFDHDIACRQIAQLVDASSEQVRQDVFGSGLELRYERGELSSAEFHEAIRQLYGACDFDALMMALADIFESISDVHDIVTELDNAGRRLGILSNTCEAHWLFCHERYDVLTRFELFALSYELRSLKPDAEIYSRAAELADVKAQHIFFVDDRAENIAAAREAGFDAVRFTTAAALRAELMERGLM